MNVVVKPRKGYGSVNTTVIKTKNDLESYLQNMSASCDSPLEMMVEGFVTGQMYHVDGFVYQGKARLIWPSCYVNTVVNFEANNFIAGYSLLPTNPMLKRIQDYVSRVCTALHTPDGPDTYPFHAEVWLTPEDEIVFCEIASRTGGGGIPTQLNALFGVTLRKLHLQHQVGIPITYETKDIQWDEREPILHQSVGWIYVYPKIGKVTLPSLCEEKNCLFYEPLVPSGHIYQNRKSCADAVCCFIVSGDTEENAMENIFKMFDWFESNSVWETE
eukprot:TRINITY_DN5053_c0_g1_i3.p1 TRINITY_DN5053_c0_g1~~TRINITY_DN5053_c0_g1_i3.p1  ORF type:complete len:273 (+),score=50.02 TRINITY_DN5053_c0_g1_i3:698-1516(+)